jgi:hypothetical protein
MMDTEVLIRPETTPAGVADQAVPDERCWFEAPTRFGALRFSVTGAPRHAADAAISLQRCERLLDALDDWSGSALAWRWIEEPPPTTTASHACAYWDPDRAHFDRVELTPQQAAYELELPWAWLRTLPAPAHALAAQLHWPELPMVLAVSQLRLGADELALLEPGGAVVLPESLQPSWHGWLRALDEPAESGRGVPILLSSPSSARRLKASAANGHAAGADDSTWCEVRLSTRHTVPADRLAGWSEDDLGEIGPRASLWCCATDHEPARPLAGGRLIPWGDGWALALEVLCEHTRVGAAKVHCPIAVSP